MENEEAGYFWNSMSMCLLVWPDQHPFCKGTMIPLLFGDVICVGLALPPPFRGACMTQAWPVSFPSSHSNSGASLGTQVSLLRLNPRTFAYAIGKQGSSFFLGSHAGEI